MRGSFVRRARAKQVHVVRKNRRSTKWGSVGGTARGARTGNATRDSACRLATFHLSLITCHRLKYEKGMLKPSTPLTLRPGPGTAKVGYVVAQDGE